MPSPNGVHDIWLVSPARLLRPVTVPAVLVMVKVLEKSLTKPPRIVLKLPDSVKVPGKGPVAVPLTEKLKFPSKSPLQVPVSVDVDPLTGSSVKVSPASE